MKQQVEKSFVRTDFRKQVLLRNKTFFMQSLFHFLRNQTRSEQIINFFNSNIQKKSSVLFYFLEFEVIILF